MNLDQIRALLGLDLTTWWRAYLTCAVMCGLRPGELLGPRWEDVDFEAGVVRVRKCLKSLPDPVTGKRVLVLEELKTERVPAHDQDAPSGRDCPSRAPEGAGRREAAARRCLRRPRPGHRVRRRCGSAEMAPGRQEPLPDALRPCWYRQGWTPREQRHTFVSVLSDSGVDIEQIADAVGHVNSTVTKTVYRHQIADEITSAATVMDSIFGGAKGS
jgi:integrase